MSEYEPRDEHLDPGARTEMWQAFAARGEEPGPVRRGKAVGAPFRLLTLAAGLAIFAALVWLLFRL